MVPNLTRASKGFTRPQLTNINNVRHLNPTGQKGKLFFLNLGNDKNTWQQSASHTGANRKNKDIVNLEVYYYVKVEVVMQP